MAASVAFDTEPECKARKAPAALTETDRRREALEDCRQSAKPRECQNSVKIRKAKKSLASTHANARSTRTVPEGFRWTIRCVPVDQVKPSMLSSQVRLRIINRFGNNGRTWHGAHILLHRHESRKAPLRYVRKLSWRGRCSTIRCTHGVQRRAGFGNHPEKGLSPP
jgi:hypothetical protein